MGKEIIIKTLRKQDFATHFDWRNFCEELGLDPIAPSIEIAILRNECSNH